MKMSSTMQTGWCAAKHRILIFTMEKHQYSTTYDVLEVVRMTDIGFCENEQGRQRYVWLFGLSQYTAAKSYILKPTIWLKCHTYLRPENCVCKLWKRILKAIFGLSTAGNGHFSPFSTITSAHCSKYSCHFTLFKLRSQNKNFEVSSKNLPTKLLFVKVNGFISCSTIPSRNHNKQVDATRYSLWF